MTLTSVLSAIGFGDGKTADARAAWRAWENGDIARAQALAQQALVTRPGSAGARHMMFLTAFVQGQYQDALDHFHTMGARYCRREELTEPVADALIHLGAIADAMEFARGRRGLPAKSVQRLEMHAHRPLRVEQSGVAVVPFADHPLSAFFPAFGAEINGRPLTTHIDTGGSFLAMGPERAAALGIQTTSAGSSRAHLNMTRVEMAYGIAERFVLGDAVLHNVPVDVLSTLTGEHDWVIFGTNILERFLSTLDYPNHRLILSRRGDAGAAEAHRAMLPAERTTVPFCLWSDHYMFARGGLGARRDLNFFVDSGLVSLHPDGNGAIRQASFTCSKKQLRKWGIPGGDIGRGFFESPDPITLGPLSEDRPLIVVGAAGDQNFGGVRIDGLISHAFLKRYAWTIDFDAHLYTFTAAVPRGSAGA
jgi:hypothetical protein